MDIGLAFDSANGDGTENGPMPSDDRSSRKEQENDLTSDVR